MTVAEKMKAVGIQSIAGDAKVEASTAYRWFYALRDGGSVPDRAKHAIIAATASSQYSITWSEFA